MAQVFIGIGSNKNRSQHIQNAITALYKQFYALRLSTVFESDAVGFDGAPFYNLVAGFNTELKVSELSLKLKQIEQDNGRCQVETKFSGRTLDIDLLLYGQLSGNYAGIKLPRDEILYNAFVLRPLAEIAPEYVHPEQNLSCRTLWQNYNQNQQKLKAISFLWQGNSLPCNIG